MITDHIAHLIQTASWLVASVGGTAAAYKAVTELRQANKERTKALQVEIRELRWRKVEMARQILDQLWLDALARSAMRMLDWDGLCYANGSAQTGPIKHELMGVALRTINTRFSPDEQYVRHAFDQLFDGFERIEHYLQVDLIEFDDCKGRLAYYVGLLSRRKPIMDNFLSTYGYDNAKTLLCRFPIWRDANTR